MANIISSFQFLLVLLINIQVLVSARPKSLEGSAGYSAWDIIHLEDSIRHGILPNFSNIGESKHGHNRRSSHLVYDEDHFDEAKKLQSSPGCPEPFERAPWVYSLVGEEPRPKCYLAGFQGPCPPNMKLYPQSSSYYGYCDCDCKQYVGYKVNVPRTYCIGPVQISGGSTNIDYGPVEYSNRILAFDRESDTCQILFEQGRCGEDEWAVFGDDPTQGLICETRQCPSTLGENFAFYDFKTRECHRVNEECGNQELKNKNDTSDATKSSSSLERDYNWLRHSYQLHENNWMPECQIDVSYQEVQYKYYGSRIQPFQCETYERFSYVLGRCVPVFTRKFGLG